MPARPHFDYCHNSLIGSIQITPWRSLAGNFVETDFVDVRIYTLDNKGALEFLFSAPLTHFGNCPNSGDIVCQWTPLRVEYLTVLRRYFIDPPDMVSRGWCVIVEPLSAPKEADKVFEEWESLTKWDEEIERKEKAKEEKERDEKLNELILRIKGDGNKQPSKKKSRSPASGIVSKKRGKPA